MSGYKAPTAPTPTAARTDHDWQDRASCRTSGDHPDLWHAAPSDHHAIRDAKEVCDACPVRNECAAYALADPTLTGVWGGTSDDERQGACDR